jgi:hypothetical protein
MNDKEMNQRQIRRRHQNCVAEKGLTKEGRNPANTEETKIIFRLTGSVRKPRNLIESARKRTES